jgi:hypothetical protein
VRHSGFDESEQDRHSGFDESKTAEVRSLFENEVRRRDMRLKGFLVGGMRFQQLLFVLGPVVICLSATDNGNED